MKNLSLQDRLRRGGGEAVDELLEQELLGQSAKYKYENEIQKKNMKPKYKYGTPCARCVPPRGRGAASRSPCGQPRGGGRGGSAGVAEKRFSRLMKINLLKIQD